MKHLKSKLFASFIMLLIAAIMVTGTSFAWFTVSTAPTISGLDFEMTATQNLEIAKATYTSGSPYAAPVEVGTNDAGDETKWGATVTSFGNGESKVTFPAHEVTDGTNVCLGTIKYDKTGRTNGLWTYTEMTGASKASYGNLVYESIVDGYQPITANVLWPDATDLDDGLVLKKEIIGGGYYVWLRSNISCEVTATVKASKDLVVGTDDALIAKLKQIKVLLEKKDATETPANSGLYQVASDVTFEKATTTVNATTGVVTAKIKLTANVPTLVRAILYIEGEHNDTTNGVIAKSVAEGFTFEGLKIEFKSDDIDAYKNNTIAGVENVWDQGIGVTAKTAEAWTAKTFTKGAIVTYNHKAYTAAQNAAATDEPGVATTVWTANNTYTTFDKTKTYTASDSTTVFYNGVEYKCTTAVSNPGEWTGTTNWTAVS